MRKCNKVPGPGSGIEVKKTVCTICDPATQCGLSLYVKDGEIIKVEGDENQPFGQGTLCVKGVSQRQYIYNEERIKTPLRRTGPRGSGEFEPISWEEAYAEIAKNLNGIKAESGAESVVFYSGYTKFYRPWFKRLCHSFGSPNYCTESSACNCAQELAQKLVWGSVGGPDFGGGLKCVLVWSANPFYTNPGRARALQGALDRGAKMIVVDPRHTPTTQRAHIHLRPRPGTDGALALAMANVLITEELYNKEFVEQYTHGFAEYKAYVAEYTPERGEVLTGVSAELIREAARLFAKESPSAVLPSAAPVVHQTNGVQNYRAIHSLVGLMGNFDVPGGQYVGKESFVDCSGLFETREHEFRQSRPYSEMAPRIGDHLYGAWAELVTAECQAMAIPEQLRTGKPYRLRALVGQGMNYRMWPNSDGFAELLKGLDFMVNTDLFMTDTCKLADIVLPACTSSERTEFRCWGNGFATCTSPAIKPLHNSRPDIDIICDLAKYIAPEDTLLASGFDATMDWMLEPSGMTVAELRKHPSGMFVPNPQVQPYRKYLDGGFKTPTGKLEFYSEVLARNGYDALPAYYPPKQSLESTPELAKDYPMVLNAGSRLPMFVHTRTYRVPWLKSMRPDAPSCDINAQDAQAQGLKQGDTVNIVSPVSAITVKVNITQTGLPGVVHLYHGNSQQNPNNLLREDYLDPISGYPGYKSSLCRLEKVEG